MASGSNCHRGCENHKLIQIGVSTELLMFNQGPAEPGDRQLYLISRSEKENNSIDMELGLSQCKWQRLVEALANVLNGPPKQYYFSQPNPLVQDADDFKITSESEPTRKHFVMIQMSDNPFEPDCDRWISLSDNSLIAIIQADAEIQNFWTHGL